MAPAQADSTAMRTDGSTRAPGGTSNASSVSTRATSAMRGRSRASLASMRTIKRSSTGGIARRVDGAGGR